MGYLTPTYVGQGYPDLTVPRLFWARIAALLSASGRQIGPRGGSRVYNAAYLRVQKGNVGYNRQRRKGQTHAVREHSGGELHDGLFRRRP